MVDLSQGQHETRKGEILYGNAPFSDVSVKHTADGLYALYTFSALAKLRHANTLRFMLRTNRSVQMHSTTHFIVNLSSSY